MTSAKVEQMTRKTKAPFNPGKFPAEVGKGTTIVDFDENDVIFAQGDPANALFNIQKGKVKLTVVSNAGKEAVIAVLGSGDFFGEGSLVGQPLRVSTATAMTECSIMRLERAAAVERLPKDPVFSKLLLSYVLTRSIRIAGC